MTYGEGAFHRWLGLELLGNGEDRARTRLAPRPEFLQEEGVVQGGVLSALADATAVYALVPRLGPERGLTSVEFKLNFLRAAVLEGGPLEGDAEVVRAGRTLAVCRARLRQGEHDVAEGLFTYLFLARP